MPETIILDPTAVSWGRAQLDITQWVNATSGINWGDAEIAAQLADMSVGSQTVDFRLPNRTVEIPLVLKTVGTTTFAAFRSSLQRKVALIQREGGWISRQSDQGIVYADIVNATLHLGGSWAQAYRGYDVDATLSLECVPDFYGPAVALVRQAGSPAGTYTRLLRLGSADAVIAGDHPGRFTVTVTGLSANDQRGLLWGVRSRYYDAAPTAALLQQAENMLMLNGAVLSGTTLVQSPPLSSSGWTPFLSMELAAGGNFTHRGTYRVWARTRCTAANQAPRMRLSWGVGSLSVPRRNTPVAVPTGIDMWMLDMGVIEVRESGPWFGILEAIGGDDGESVRVDYLLFQPLDEYAGLLAASPADPVSALSMTKSIATKNLANDASYGNVAWNISGGGGQAVAILNTAQISNYLKLTNLGFNVPSAATIVGIAAHLTIQVARIAITDRVRLIKGGTIQAASERSQQNRWTGLQTLNWGNAADMWATALTPADVNAANFGLAVTFRATPSDFAWVVVQSGTIVVFYTLSPWMVDPDAVIHGTQLVTLDTAGVSNVTSAGAWGPVSVVQGDLPRVPPSGVDNRKVELLVSTSRGDYAAVPDNGADNFNVDITYRPSYLFLP